MRHIFFIILFFAFLAQFKLNSAEEPQPYSDMSRIKVTYMDGLGRTIQIVRGGAGGDYEDLVELTEYGNNGKISRQWQTIAQYGNTDYIDTNSIKTLYLYTTEDAKKRAKHRLTYISEAEAEKIMKADTIFSFITKIDWRPDPVIYYANGIIYGNQNDKDFFEKGLVEAVSKKQYQTLKTEEKINMPINYIVFKLIHTKKNLFHLEILNFKLSVSLMNYTKNNYNKSLFLVHNKLPLII